MTAAANRSSDRWPRRYTLVGLCFLGIFVCYIDRVNISIAAIAMQNELGWSDTLKGYVLSSFFIGYMVTQLPGGVLANRYGGKLILGFAVIWWSIFTILTPPAAAISFGLLIAVRIAMGIGEGMAFPATFNLYGRWVPSSERARVVAITMAGISLGTVTALLLTGEMVERWGWQSVFYIFGCTGLVWFVFWQWKVTNTPGEHPEISAEELAFIEATAASPDVSESVPYRAIFSSAAVWAVIINHFCVNWGTFVLVAWLPSYFFTEFGLSLRDSGFASAAPWLSMFVFSYVGAWIADSMIKRGFSVTYVRKQQQTVGLLGAAAFLLLVSTIEAGESARAILYMCCGLGALSLCSSGYATNILDISPRYADVLLGVTSTAGTVPGIIGVALNGYLVDQTGSFDPAFALAAGIFVFGAAVYLLFATGKKLFD